MDFLSVQDICKKAGVTRRTLQHYDDLNLLTPASRSEGGFRLYNADSLETLYEILLYKELGFHLKEIREILNGSEQDRIEIISDKLVSLRKKRDHLDSLIGFAEALIFTGLMPVPFDETTDKSYKDFLSTTTHEWNMHKTFDEIKLPDLEGDEFFSYAENFDTLCKLSFLEPESTLVQHYIGAIYNMIEEMGMGKLSIDGFRVFGMMQESGNEICKIRDQQYGDGTSDFLAKAIEIYCNEVSRTTAENLE